MTWVSYSLILQQIFRAMNSIEIFKAPYAKATYIPDYKAILITWNGIHTIDEYKKVFSSGIEFQQSTNLPVHNYISDIRNQGIVNPESRKWFENVAIPKATELGLKRAAVVFDGNVFRKYYLNMVIQAANIYKIPLKTYNTPEEAFNWFKSFDD